MSHRLLRSVQVALLLLLSAALTPAGAAAATTPQNCVHEKRTWWGSFDPTGLCVSTGYGVKPAGASAGAPTTQNVFATWGNEQLAADVFIRSDIADGIARKVARPRAAFLLLYGGGFVCGSRADVVAQAREVARRGYIAITAEYPLSALVDQYGHYAPNPGYRQGQITTPKSNPCPSLEAQLASPEWTQGFLPRLRQHGLEPGLEAAQLTLQSLVRAVKTTPSLGVDPKRIFALGFSAGGAVALRLAFAGNDDIPWWTTEDPGDSTIAGAISISGPACFPGSTALTAPIFDGQVRPSEMPACRWSVDSTDPQVLMLQEPRGGKEDTVVPGELMRGSCEAINAAVPGRCVYEDRAAGSGGYLYDGDHAYLTSGYFSRLIESLSKQGVGAP